jgi:hypothetical protein
MSDRLSVRMEQLVSQFKFYIRVFFRKTVENIQVPLKTDKNKGYFIRRPIYIFYHTSLNSS